MKDKGLIGIIGATALGKTQLAVQFAAGMDGEVISADSRQVYRGMDIGTGKDLNEFNIAGKAVPFHLIDIVDAGEEYNVFQYQKDFYEAYQRILDKQKIPVLCGGTGMYIEAALRRKKYLEVPLDEELRHQLGKMPMERLQQELKSLKEGLHNTTDLLDRDRLLRAIEIEKYKKEHPNSEEDSTVKNYRLFGLKTSRQNLHKRIAQRLDFRLKNGMVKEVENLLKAGVSHEKLRFYGLEYRYISDYLTGKLQKNDMRNHLLKAIKQFAKRQETWFRRMEKRGEHIHWLNAENTAEENTQAILDAIK